MIPVLTVFDWTILQKELGPRFQVSRITRFPYLDLARVSMPGSILFVLCDSSNLSALSVTDQELLTSQIRELQGFQNVVFMLMPSLVRDGFSLGSTQQAALEKLRQLENVKILDATPLSSLLGNKAIFQDQLRYLTTCPYSSEFLELVADWLQHLVSFHSHRNRKLIVVDLDNTLWGGILSEAGSDSLEMDPEDSLGRAYLDLQQELIHARSMGYLIAACSKNYESEVLHVFNSSKYIRLKKDDFALISASWQSKDLQISEICKRLRIADKDVIFIDDDPHERDLVRNTHPEIFVPELASSPYERPSSFRRLIGIENPFLTSEDRGRTDSYVHNLARESLKLTRSSHLDWLNSLDAELTATDCDKELLNRAHQLYQRTSQFNLRPVRRTQKDIVSWLDSENRQLFLFRYRDRVGDDGIIGLIALEVDHERMLVKDFLLSCRVFGRGIEDSMTQWLMNRAEALKISKIYFEILDTGRNRVGMNFVNRIGLSATDLVDNSNSSLYALNPQKLSLAPSLVVKNG